MSEDGDEEEDSELALPVSIVASARRPRKRSMNRIAWARAKIFRYCRAPPSRASLAP